MNKMEEGGNNKSMDDYRRARNYYIRNHGKKEFQDNRKGTKTIL